MSMKNPPGKTLREKSWRGAEKRIEQYYGLAAILQTWEQQPDEVQIANHDYIIALRARVRMVKSYVLHRADPRANVV